VCVGGGGAGGSTDYFACTFVKCDLRGLCLCV
jgi:hypothetical protein